MNRAAARRDFTTLGAARTHAHAHAHEKIERVGTARGKQSKHPESRQGRSAMEETRDPSRGSRKGAA
jgi:hypothetical protein